MAVREILLLGNPLLYEPSAECLPGETGGIMRIAADLRDTLNAFRAEKGFGRAIAAPQIGEQKRIIWFDPGEPQVLVNPALRFPDNRMITLWDDCMSFPGLLVRVKRYLVCELSWYDEQMRPHTRMLEGDLSELIQHEYDHLDGILAVQRAIDDRSLAFAVP